jgi:dihydroxyacetone kinase-like protein
MRFLEGLIMGMTVASIRYAITRVLVALEAQHQDLTELDGKIGDGDLGITLLKAFRELDRIKGDLPEDIGQALIQSASGVAKVSSSSFGTLLATSLMTGAKQLKGSTSAPWVALPGLMDQAVAAMAMRGKSSLGDKTVLDALSGAAKSAAGMTEKQEMLAAARQGVESALAEFRDKPNKIGRARIFADRTIGMDDPGMVALKVMLGAL